MKKVVNFPLITTVMFINLGQISFLWKCS